MTFNIQWEMYIIFIKVQQKRFGSKIIENYDLINELNRNVRRDLLINKCNNFTFDQIKDLHYTMYDYRKQNVFSKIFFIIDDSLMDNYTNNKCNK